MERASLAQGIMIT